MPVVDNKPSRESLQVDMSRLVNDVNLQPDASFSWTHYLHIVSLCFLRLAVMARRPLAVSSPLYQLGHGDKSPFASWYLGWDFIVMMSTRGSSPWCAKTPRIRRVLLMGWIFSGAVHTFWMLRMEWWIKDGRWWVVAESASKEGEMFIEILNLWGEKRMIDI